MINHDQSSSVRIELSRNVLDVKATQDVATCKIVLSRNGTPDDLRRAVEALIQKLQEAIA